MNSFGTQSVQDSNNSRDDLLANQGEPVYYDSHSERVEVLYGERAMKQSYPQYDPDHVRGLVSLFSIALWKMIQRTRWLVKRRKERFANEDRRQAEEREIQG